MTVWEPRVWKMAAICSKCTSICRVTAQSMALPLTMTQKEANQVNTISFATWFSTSAMSLAQQGNSALMIDTLFYAWNTLPLLSFAWKTSTHASKPPRAPQQFKHLPLILPVLCVTTPTSILPDTQLEFQGSTNYIITACGSSFGSLVEPLAMVRLKYLWNSNIYHGETQDRSEQRGFTHHLPPHPHPRWNSGQGLGREKQQDSPVYSSQLCQASLVFVLQSLSTAGNCKFRDVGWP